MGKYDQKYQFINQVGRGAFGRVFKARRRGTSQIVAIKVIPKKNKSEKDLNNNRQEIQILKKLRHENVVLHIDSFENSSQIFLVTEYGQGQLYSIIEDDKTLSQLEVRKIAIQLIRALHYIHSNRITHRDMKPQNILIAANGIVKLCDFGFARSMNYNSQLLTSLKGTPLYMAPQLLQQQPYNHTADLWSLGIILYELYCGHPPFMSEHIYSLIEHIVRDPIKYPQSMSAQFRGFLKCLLVKNASQRSDWPSLLEHSFIRQKQHQITQRKLRQQKYANWIQCLTQTAFQIEQTKNKNQNTNIKPQPKNPSPSKNLCMDDLWNSYEAKAQEEKGATMLRSDSQFLQRLFSLLQTGMTEILRSKQKKAVIQCGLRVLCFVIIKGKIRQNRIDIIRNANLSNLLFSLLKNTVRIDYGKQFIDLLNDILKASALISKNTFDHKVGIQMVYIRSFIPQIPFINKAILSGQNPQHHNLAITLIKNVGLLVNNACVNYVRSFNFYKDLVQINFIQDSIYYLKHFTDQNNTLLKYQIQLLSAFVHPLNGSISTFPWKRSISPSIAQFNDCFTMFEVIKQTILNSLLQIDWAFYFVKLFLFNKDESLNLNRISIFRIILQLVRISKQFAQRILSQRQIFKIILTSIKHEQPLIFSTDILIITLLLKSNKDKKELQKELITNLGVINDNFYKYYRKNPIVSICCLSLYQQLFQSQININYLNKFLQKTHLSILTELLSNNKTISKIDQIGKIQGSAYGVYAYGFNDIIITFMHKLFVNLSNQTRIQKDKLKIHDFFRQAEDAHLKQSLLSVLTQLSPKSSLSPRGLIAYLMFIHQLVINDYSNFSSQLFKPIYLKAMMSLLQESQLMSIQEWPPDYYGGGNSCLHLLTVNLLKLFNLSLQTSDRELVQILNCFYKNQLVGLSLNCTKYLQKQQINLTINFISRLIMQNDPEKPFAMQFIVQNGLGIFQKFGLLQQSTPLFLLLQSLALLSQIARTKKQYYEYIDRMNPFQYLKRLIVHKQAVVRAKVCNLIGNLCKHSPYFYQSLLKYDLIRDTVTCCRDTDKSTRKFACFAIGNAAFHNDYLYQKLRTSIPVLVDLLNDVQIKTISNAAGAIGNLMRNSSILYKDLVKSKGISEIIKIIRDGKDLSSIKICFFCLVNISNFEQCRDSLRNEFNIKGICKQFAYSKDSSIKKNVIKIQKNLFQKQQ